MRLEDEIKQTTFQSEAQKAQLNIMFTASWMGQQQLAAFRPLGLTPPQFNVLRILRGQHPKPATVALLIDRMLDKTSNASRIVDKLEEKQLVTRQVCHANRRAVDIRITEDGLALLRRVDEQDLLFQAPGTKQMSADELRTLNELLDKLRA